MSSVQEAQELLAKADIHPREHNIINEFVALAADPETAAQYLLSQIRDTQPLKTSLQEFLSTWGSLASRSRC
jgi:hypothetical protein